MVLETELEKIVNSTGFFSDLFIDGGAKKAMIKVFFFLPGIFI